MLKHVPEMTLLELDGFKMCFRQGWEFAFSLFALSLKIAHGKEGL